MYIYISVLCNSVSNSKCPWKVIPSQVPQLDVKNNCKLAVFGTANWPHVGAHNIHRSDQ